MEERETGVLIAPFHACIIRLHASNGGVISRVSKTGANRILHRIYIYSMKAGLLGLSCSVENYWKIIFLRESKDGRIFLRIDNHYGTERNFFTLVRVETRFETRFNLRKSN